ncbi:MAG: hypothetical protein U5R48_00710 [Gammaproteobacteria bacterium]|nr:hypothetical protein [Gammaproteobacteria bacterium]
MVAFGVAPALVIFTWSLDHWGRVAGSPPSSTWPCGPGPGPAST